MAEEEKGFIVKDRRSFGEDGALKSEQTVKEEKKLGKTGKGRGPTEEGAKAKARGRPSLA